MDIRKAIGAKRFRFEAEQRKELLHELVIPSDRKTDALIERITESIDA